ncbi:MAG: type IV pilus biogenesis/stability protein PilW [Burkholderiales bacterium]|nr:type IV pilus biogenesis/stability protein PilW [Burkholderiales bacterium]
MKARARLRRAAAAACVALAGCAGQPGGGDATLKPMTSTTGTETADQVRARVHTELAASYFELGNLPVALEEAKEALRSDANFGPAHNVLGLVYGALKEDRLAEASFQRALQVNALDSDANHNYGQFLCLRKREDEGIRHFLAAVRNPLYQGADGSYANAGVCARRKGDSAAAEGYFQLALKLRPGHPQALYNMADISYAKGDFEGARGYLARLTKVVRPNAEVLWLGVRIERRLGDRIAEASYATQLRKNFPDSREARALAAGEN